MTSPGVRLDQDGPVATVTLCRPEVRNAQTLETWVALRDFGMQLPGDVRAVVVRGEGPAFSAGLDRSLLQPGPSGEVGLADFAALSETETEGLIEEFQKAFAWLRRPDLISVAAVQGHAVGAGFQLALACDLRVLATDARLVMAEVSHGLVPDLGGTKRLVELVGYARALEICVTGREVGADEAAALGLANLVVPPTELTAAVADLLAAVLAADRATVTEIKALVGMAADRSYADQERAERQAQVRRIRDLIGIGE